MAIKSTDLEAHLQRAQKAARPRRDRKEGDVVAAVLKVCEAYGVFAWRNNTGALRTEKRFVRFGKKGSADILGILPGGRFLAIECKSRSGHVTPEQHDFLARVEREGGLAIVVKDTIDELVKVLPRAIGMEAR